MNRPIGPITNNASKIATTPSTTRRLVAEGRAEMSPDLDLDLGAAR